MAPTCSPTAGSWPGSSTSIERRRHAVDAASPAQARRYHRAVTTEYGPAWSAGLRRADAGELRDWLDFAMACADIADEAALQGLRQEHAVDVKADGSFVTEVDRTIETTIRSRILE